MQTFRRLTLELVKSTLLCIAITFTCLVLLLALEAPLPLLIAIPVVLAAVLVWFTILAESIRIKVDTNGMLYHYQYGRLRKTLCLADYKGSRSSRPAGRNPMAVNYLILVLEPIGDGQKVRLDCSPLGHKQFEQLCKLVADYCASYEKTPAEYKKPPGAL